ncbi:hypothetical protein [Superficieibacter sp. 1612_C1]|uniref:hypothetical protein n=1 Tax=Superficieibacter sp. 1612_C1 TaxID=2780382 RepID=UPI0018846686|nr:hypothetical protein [Superficieibacter sp. 1612_C1]
MNGSEEWDNPYALIGEAAVRLFLRKAVISHASLLECMEEMVMYAEFSRNQRMRIGLMMAMQELREITGT